VSGGPWLLLAHFGVACAGSVLLATILGALLRRLASRWPALRAHRSVWLSAQLAIVLGMLLAIAPLPRSAVAPTVMLPAVTDGAPVTRANAAMLPAPADAGVAAPASDPIKTALNWLPGSWLAFYLAGLAWHAARRLRASRHWRDLLRRHTHAVDATGLLACPAITPHQRIRIASGRLAVRTIDLPVSPMLHGVLRPCLLLPAHLATLDVGQQRLIVEHELTHWRRADPFWLALSGILALACWFNRPMQRLHEALREAVELGCDDAVLAGRASDERRSYAAALVAQLRLQLQWQAHGAAAFGSVGVAGRVQRMREKNAARLGMPARILAGASLFGLTLAGAALQPAFSHAPMVSMVSTVPMVPMAPLAPAAPGAMPAPTAAAMHAHDPWRWPLAEARVTSLYGVRSPSRPKGHHGIDLAARRGTPVHAVAAGSVAEAAFAPDWGHYVRVDHGGGRSSLLIHLERIDVTPGQQVAAGDPLGASGASGKATGAHLHLEYWQDGQRLDPAIVLPDLFARATPKAIAQRKAQDNPIPTDL